MFGKKKVKVTFDDMPNPPISERFPLKPPTIERIIEKQTNDYKKKLEEYAVPILCALITREGGGVMPSSTEDFLPKVAVKMAKGLISEIKSASVDHGQMLQRLNDIKLK